MARTARQVTLLRGVNVGGINIKMADLARVFRGDLGLEGVKTVLASGNVLFDAPSADGALKARIEGALRKAFGYDACVILVEQGTLARVVEAYPFPEVDEMQPYVMFVADPSAMASLLDYPREGEVAERVQPGDGVIYWEVTKGQTLEGAFGKHASKPRFKPLVTTRNMRTLRKLLD